MSKRYTATVVDAMVGADYVCGFQVLVDRIETAPNGVTVVSTQPNRYPTLRAGEEGLKFHEAKAERDRLASLCEREEGQRPL